MSESSHNKELWNLVFKTDKAHVTKITGKQYSGNSPKPYWIVQRATEVFGPCGIGWGLSVSNERFDRLTDSDVLHVCLVTVWYSWDGKRGEVQQMGQTKAAYLTSKGAMLVDEDAPKKSVTDGMVKCLSMLGFAGDIFSGRWDDSKYHEESAPKAPSNATIGDEEFKVINDLLDETNADKVAFCKAYKVDSVSALPLAMFSHAVGKLQEKKRQQETANN